MQANIKAEHELSQAVINQKIPNALLFSGPYNTGRKKAAFWFVKAVNCLTSGSRDSLVCDQCRSCIKINSETHPDVLAVQAPRDKKQISISQIRQIQSALSVRPHEARYRMVLIEDAHLLNVQAQNALLKMLEEPPDRTFFVLISHQDDLLLPTIHSRCRKLSFRPLAPEAENDVLTGEYGIDPVIAQIAMTTAEDDLARAKSFFGIDASESPVNWPDRRIWLINAVLSLIRHRGSDPARATHNSLAVSWRISLDPKSAPDLMAILKTVIRDLIIFEHAPKKIVNLDFFSQFKDISEQLPRNVLSKWAVLLLETEKKISSNCGLKLALDSFFINFVTTE